MSNVFVKKKNKFKTALITPFILLLINICIHANLEIGSYIHINTTLKHTKLLSNRINIFRRFFFLDILQGYIFARGKISILWSCQLCLFLRLKKESFDAWCPPKGHTYLKKFYLSMYDLFVDNCRSKLLNKRSILIYLKVYTCKHTHTDTHTHTRTHARTHTNSPCVDTNWFIHKWKHTMLYTLHITWILKNELINLYESPRLRFDMNAFPRRFRFNLWINICIKFDITRILMNG